MSAWYVVKNGKSKLAKSLSPSCNSTITVEEVLPNLELVTVPDMSVFKKIGELVKSQDTLMHQVSKIRSCHVTPLQNSMMDIIALYLRETTIWVAENVPMEYYRLGNLIELGYLGLVFSKQIEMKTFLVARERAIVGALIDTVMKAIASMELRIITMP